MDLPGVSGLETSSTVAAPEGVRRRSILLALVVVGVPAELLTPVDFTFGALIVLPVFVMAASDNRRWTVLSVLLAMVGRLICVAGGAVDAWEAVADCLAYGLAGALGTQLVPNASRSAAAGEKPTTSNWDSLTRREREVIAMVIEGLTSKEVGRRLHISERTVERHLEKAYTTLAIHGRRDLRRAHETRSSPSA